MSAIGKKRVLLYNIHAVENKTKTDMILVSNT